MDQEEGIIDPLSLDNKNYEQVEEVIPPESPDELKGWTIVALGFIIDALAKGGKAIFVVMVLLWGEEFGWSRSQLSLLGALVHISISVMTPVSGTLIDSFPGTHVVCSSLTALSLAYLCTALVESYWQAILSYGVFCGMAFGSINLNVFSTVVVNAMPPGKRGRAVGITNAGSTFGQFAFVPLFTFLVQGYGWRNCYVALSVATAALILPSYFLLPTKSQREISLAVAASSGDGTGTGTGTGTGDGGGTREKERGAGGPSGKAEAREEEGDGDGDGGDAGSLWARCSLLCLSRIYWALGVSFFICGFTTTGFLETHLVALVVEKGLTLRHGGLAFSVIAACNGGALVLCGYLADKVDRRLLLTTIYSIRGCMYLLLLLAFNSSRAGVMVLFIFSVIFGLVDYSVIPPVVSLVKSNFPHMVGLAVGILLCLHSAGAAVGAAAGGWIFEGAEGNYDVALMVCVGLLGVAATVVLLGLDMEHQQ